MFEGRCWSLTSVLDLFTLFGNDENSELSIVLEPSSSDKKWMQKLLRELVFESEDSFESEYFKVELMSSYVTFSEVKNSSQTPLWNCFLKGYISNTPFKKKIETIMSDALRKKGTMGKLYDAVADIILEMSLNTSTQIFNQFLKSFTKFLLKNAKNPRKEWLVVCSFGFEKLNEFLHKNSSNRKRVRAFQFFKNVMRKTERRCRKNLRSFFTLTEVALTLNEKRKCEELLTVINN